MYCNIVNRGGYFMKKVLSFILAVAMTVSLATGFAADITAEEVYAVQSYEPTIIVGSAAGVQGSEVEITIGLKNNPGIVSMCLMVKFPSELTLIEVNDAGVLGATLHNPSKTSPYYLCWVNDTARENFTANGTIVTLKFKISNTAKHNEEFPITVSYTPNNFEIIDKDANEIDFAIENGKISVYCSHKDTVYFPAVASTCIKHGRRAYTLCNDCGNVISGDSSELPFADHVGEATCVSKAVCKVCGVSYGEIDSNNHKNTHVVGHKDATCCEKGYTGDVFCDDCQKTVSVSTEIAATGNHVDVDGKWETDENGHFHTCYFGTEFDRENHKGGNASCVKLAVCSVCGESYGGLGQHSFSENPAPEYLKVSATCVNRAVYYKSCSVCGKADTETFEYGDFVAHEFNENPDSEYLKVPATCVNKAVYYKSCSICGKADTETFEYGDFAAHEFCEKPDSEFLKVPATCVDSSIYYKSCSVCKEKSEETFVYGEPDHNNHTGGTYLSGEVDSTCHSKGYTGDTYCNSCNTKLQTGEVLTEKPHDYQHDTMAPVIGKRGYTLHTCKVCKYSYKDNYTVYEGEDAPVISVSSLIGIVGSKVRVAVSLKNNPGIVSMSLKLNYDDTVLKLVDVEDCGILGDEMHKPNLKSPYYLNWVNDTATENYSVNGNIVILTFEVLENAPLGKTPITVSYEYDNYDIYDVDAEEVVFAIENGYVDVSDILIGDVNGDGIINNYDRLLLSRWLAKWPEALGKGIIEAAADVNCDGKVNNLDRLTLARHLAHWEEYANLPYTK